MIKNILTLFFTALSCQVMLAQMGANCTPDNPIMLLRNEFSENNVKSKIEVSQKTYTDEEIAALKKQISACNTVMEGDLRGIQLKSSEFARQYLNVLTVKDVKSIERQIKALELSRDSIRRVVQQNLLTIKHTGVFVVLQPGIPAFPNKNTLIQNAQVALSPLAVSNLNGSSIERLTKVQDFKAMEDIVRSVSKGKVAPEEELASRTENNLRLFIYAAKVAVSPIIEERIKNNAPEVASNTTVLDATVDDIEKALIEAKVPKDFIVELMDRIAIKKDIVERENADADQREEAILSLSSEEIRKIDSDIAEYKNRLKTRSEKIGALLKSLNLPYDPKDVEGSAARAIQALKAKLDENALAWNKVKERELQYRESTPPSQGEAIETIAKETMRLIEQAKQSFGTLKKTVEVTEVTNMKDVNYQATQEVQVYRDIEKIWVYIAPQSNDAYKILVVTKFSIKEVAPVGNTRGNPVTEQPKLPVANTTAPPQTSGTGLPEVQVSAEPWKLFDGSVESELDKAKRAYRAGDTKKAFDLLYKYREKSQFGMDAARLLAACAVAGLGTNVDYDLALQYFRKAANMGDVYSKTQLGLLYEYGRGVPKNLQEAVYWYKQAAEKGDVIAQERLRLLGY